jgi:hypothetical protein
MGETGPVSIRVDESGKRRSLPKENRISLYNAL